MTDATREQIDTAAMKAWQEDGRPGSLANWTLGDDDDEARYWRSIYIKGAANQHPISYSAGLDDALRLIDQYSYGMTQAQWFELTRKLEALKNSVYETEIKK